MVNPETAGKWYWVSPPKGGKAVIVDHEGFTVYDEGKLSLKTVQSIVRKHNNAIEVSRDAMVKSMT